LGFTAKRSLEDGIQEVRKAYETGEIVDYRWPFYSNLTYLKERGQANAKNDLDVKVMAAFAGARSHASLGGPHGRAAAANGRHV
jgi:hypothetical protein